MVELADLFQGLPQLVVVAQPVAHFLDLLATQAELTGAAAGVADGQYPQPMSTATGANRAAAAVAHGPLQQRAAQQLTGHGQPGNHRLAHRDELIVFHHK